MSVSARLIALLLTAILGLAACGGGDEEATSSTTTGATGTSGATGATGTTDDVPADVAEFREEANATCEDFGADVEDALEKTAGRPPQEVAAAVGPPVRAGLEALREIEPPASEQRAYEAMIADIEAGIAAFEEDPEAEGDPFAGVEEQADSLGLGECG